MWFLRCVGIYRQTHAHTDTLITLPVNLSFIHSFIPVLLLVTVLRNKPIA